MLDRTLAITVKEFREIYRNRLYLLLAFAVPLVMFVVFGYGITLDIENMPFSYIDMDKTPQSRSLIDRFTGRYFRYAVQLQDYHQAEALLATGRLRAVLIIPSGFTKRLLRNEPAEIQLLIDGGYPYTSITIKGYAEAIVESFNQELVYSQGGRPASVLKLQSRFLFNEAVKSSNALIPGLIVVIMMVNPAVLTAIAIAREKEFGTIYNIYSTPIRKIEFLTGKLIPYYIISMINLIVLVLLIKIMFKINMKGNFVDLLPAAAVYISINILIGLLVSMLTKTVVSAQIITLIITIIPSFLYSGLLIPVSHLGDEGRVMAHIYPAMHFMKVVYGVYLKKLRFDQMLKEFFILLIYFSVLFTIALKRFKKSED